jgi:glycosyltransferase involved in cell wall biosynthesis
MKLHIAIAAPIASADVVDLLDHSSASLPLGYTGAPFTGVLIKELLRRGHKVSAFTTDNHIYAEAELIKATGANFALYICAERPRAWQFNGKRLGRAIDCFSYERQLLAKTICAVQPDIIHAHWTYEFALAALKTGLPHLITCHDAPAVVLRFNPCPYRLMRYLMARKVFFQGKHFSTVSHYMVNKIQHYTASPMQVVANPLADFVLSSGHPRKMPDTKRIGLICNGWDARKNPQPALKAFAQFSLLYPEAELHLYGHGFGDSQTAHHWCQAQKITAKLFFHGAIAHKDLITQLKQLDVLLHPSLEESFGVILAEAMALGLPIVAGRQSGAVPYVVGYDELKPQLCCAVLTDVRDSAAILKALQTVFDADYAQRSAAAYARAQVNFTPEVIVDAYLELYRQSLNLNSQGNSLCH